MQANLDQFFQSKHNRRLANESKTHDRLERLENKAEKMIGTLVREGREICYVFPVGGKYREGSKIALLDFLIRNQYVR